MNDDNINDITVSKGVGNILFGPSNRYSINQTHSNLLFTTLDTASQLSKLLIDHLMGFLAKVVAIVYPVPSF